MIRTATIDGPYRYTLTRAWEPRGERILWVMLNPSTADAHEDDPTIRRVLRFSERWGFGSCEVVNLLAWRATDPSEIPTTVDARGPQNHVTIIAAAQRATRIACAWGSLGARYPDSRDLVVRTLRQHHGALWCLGLTQSREPRHPLYVRGLWRCCKGPTVRATRGSRLGGEVGAVDFRRLGALQWCGGARPEATP
jgi:hypothetical protein